jgi:para-aminobenzoate synthetase/4-amino-4-deoxychorismate lyase
MLWTPEDGYYLLLYHLTRLRDSAVYFSFYADIDAIRDKLFSLAGSFQPAPHKVRLFLTKSGNIECEFEVIDNSSDKEIKHVCLAQSYVDSSDVFLYHKTTNRAVYDQALATCIGYDDVILWNEKGEVTESCIANIVIEIDGKPYTPPVKCGLLAGTFRAWLIEHKKVMERVLTMKDLAGSPHIYLINSIRRKQEVFVDGYS